MSPGTRPGPRLGEVVRAHRAQAGLTQEELAERAGLSVRAVSDIERGLRHTIYADTARRLAAALSLADGPAAQFIGAARGGPSDLTAPESPLRPGTLPAPLGPIIGREGLLAEVLAGLGRSRLVTLTGAGGIGKTRLALEAARELRASSSVPVVFVPLGDVQSSALFLPAMARCLGVAASGPGIAAAIASALEAEPRLLLLDTFEHLPQAATQLADLLAAAPGARALVTSRSPLRLRGEQEVPVGPLSTAGEESGAARLLSSLLPPGAGPLDLPTAEAICRRLDGVPLALELAAAQLRHTSADALLADLDAHLPVLTGGPVDLPARQRAMDDATAWSERLLSEADRALLHALSIFARGFTAAAVAEVCELEESAVTESLDRLRDASLLVGEWVDGRIAYSMLEVTRDFALRRLLQSPGREAASALRHRHALRAVRIAEEGGSSLPPERANLHAALVAMAEAGEAEIALRLAGALWMWWRQEGAFAEGAALLELALGVDPSARGAAWARASWGAGWMAFQQGQLADAAARGQALLEWSREVHQAEAERNGLTLLGMAALGNFQPETAVRLLTEALRLSEQLGPGWLLATSRLNLGTALIHAGQVDAARPILEQAAEVYRRLGDERFGARVKQQLTHVALVKGEYREALSLAEGALATFEALEDGWGRAEALDWMSAALAATGRSEEASAAAASARVAWARLGAQPHTFDRAAVCRWLEA